MIPKVADGVTKRHTEAPSWEAQVGASATSKLGFRGATPTAQRADSNQAGPTDLPSVITLASERQAALVEKGMIMGEG